MRHLHFWPSCIQADSHCSSVSERPCTELSVEPCHPSQRYRVTAAPPVCSTEHTCGPTLQTDHIRPSSISVAGPTAWNSLPVAFRDPTISDACFRQHLKTVLFAQQCRHYSVQRVRDLFMTTRCINSRSLSLAQRGDVCDGTVLSRWQWNTLRRTRWLIGSR